MSTERLVEGLGARLGRRGFVVKLGLGTVGGVLALMGFPRQVGATYPSACCNLCYPSSYSCQTGCTTCAWCWTCADGCKTIRCCECHSTNDGCPNGCYNVYCSWAECVGGCCPQIPAA